MATKVKNGRVAVPLRIPVLLFDDIELFQAVEHKNYRNQAILDLVNTGLKVWKANNSQLISDTQAKNTTAQPA